LEHMLLQLVVVEVFLM
jgi:hypothetical protein